MFNKELFDWLPVPSTTLHCITQTKQAVNGRCTPCKLHDRYVYDVADCPVSEMTYTVSSGTLNSTIPYHTLPRLLLFCTSSHPRYDSNLCIYKTSFRQWVPADRVFAYDHPHRPTTCYHDFAPSSARAPFLTLVRLHGTDYQKTFARNLTPLTFENFLKLTILILRLTFNNCILSFYL